MSGDFWVFKCTNCGTFGVKEIRVSIKKSTYKCKHCNKTKKIKPSTKFGFGISMEHYGPYNNPRIATKVCQDLNGKRCLN